ncbi:MAG: helix-turn-helix protein [Conexibacter sp.]|nr:helix-turn-helix protein [Conexibacter sp.]
MPRSAPREPTVEMRRRRRKDGSHSVEPTVRYYDEQGVRRRKRCASLAEAEFERARMALEQGQTGRLTAPADRLTLVEFWPTYHSDASSGWRRTRSPTTRAPGAAESSRASGLAPR